MEIACATTNKGKVHSANKDLAQFGITIVQAPIEIPEPRSSDVTEIAIAKVVYAYRELNRSVITLDAGFYIPSLNGFPRAFVNFALETIGLEGIL
ncbi:MAG: non-canonical purine NTP pyrophosphatase, partial [Nanoarchaeota archaeon]